MKVWTCNNFRGHWPVGTAAVVAADSIERACDVLSEMLAEEGLPQEIKPEQLQECPVPEVGFGVRILNDGDY